MGRVGEYEIFETVGTGAFSKVKRVRHIPTDACFVAKIIPKSNQRVENDIRVEISILRRLKHRNIVQLVEILESPNNYYIILEPVFGGDVCSLVLSQDSSLEEEVVSGLFFQLLAGVRACHQNGVAHRDLKPENLLLTEGNVLKISDFGLSRLHKQSNFHAQIDEYAHTLTGTLAYVAPEVFCGTYDAFKADIWSMGCILYVLLTSCFPFGYTTDARELEERIKMGRICKLPDSVSEEAKELTLWLMSLHPEDRPSLDQVALHSFLKRYVPMKHILALIGSKQPPPLAANPAEFSSEVVEEEKQVNERGRPLFGKEAPREYSLKPCSGGSSKPMGQSRKD
ncbi:putative protein kinase [Trypanosoma cruzi]|uniref:non-specific serine/threonine protein kinase n=3 Tax=Trypanosoma cruzi TaxID=5693 RepID=Q4D6W8_TRYCC|nr:protein kinase, putative [Trypanosoma cruzi]EAN88257.1 protein kinase, putative [Trypanosoma cruzi]KAF5221204.1 hypothetical protein ECC02_005772 [Trypanosoma cruzi]KAF8295635.1 putative calcium/calmodulin-dependent protein kinase [Trypanosoma cruzi]PWV16614.1 putative protein kinase [Trypanosoma cruzi]|eukprot:XP_810108.1 protein kinase [Trypanosoma cruzi strain CL Brener]